MVVGHYRIVFLAIVFLLPVLSLLAEETRKVRALARHIDEVRHPSSSYRFRVKTVDNFPSGRQETNEVQAFYYHRPDNSGFDTLSIWLNPEKSRGQIMLVKGRKVWLLLPGAKVPLRLPPRLLGHRAFTIATMNTSFEKEYTGHYDGVEKIRDKQGVSRICERVTLYDKLHRGHPFPAKVEYWIEQGTGHFVMGKYYNRFRLLRIASYGGNELTLGRDRPLDSIVFHTGRNIKTNVTGSDFSLANFPAEWFETDNLPKLVYHPEETRFTLPVNEPDKPQNRTADSQK